VVVVVLPLCRVAKALTMTALMVLKAVAGAGLAALLALASRLRKGMEWADPGPALPLTGRGKARPQGRSKTRGGFA